MSSRKKKQGGRVISVLCSVLGTLILFSVIALCLPVTLPKLAGYEIYNVVSGSMEPEIPVGSAVYVKGIPPQELEEGDVIAFWSGNSVVVHRVQENRVVEGQFVTKGDANELEDPEKAPYDAVVGRVTYHIPWLGMVMGILSGTVGKAYLICFAACGVMFHMLAGRLKNREE